MRCDPLVEEKMETTMFMVAMIVKYLLDSVPMYKLSVSRFEVERMMDGSAPKRFPVLERIMFVCETILFVVACSLFVLKCFGVLPWW